MLASEIDNFSGCYAVFDPLGTCLYVGRSNSVLTRVMAHWIDQRDGHGVRWRLAGTVEWYWPKPFAPYGCILKAWEVEPPTHFDLELELIQKLNPRHNSRRGRYDEPIYDYEI